MPRIWYSVPDVCEDSKYSMMVGDGWDFTNTTELEMLADKIGADYWYGHDGFEAEWPLEFAVFKEKNGSLVGRLRISAEPTIEFRGNSTL